MSNVGRLFKAKGVMKRMILRDHSRHRDRDSHNPKPPDQRDPDLRPEIKTFAKSALRHELAATNAVACRNSVASPPRSKPHSLVSEIGY
jgi:hypothetical protein